MHYVCEDVLFCCLCIRSSYKNIFMLQIKGNDKTHKLSRYQILTVHEADMKIVEYFLMI